MPAFLLAVRNSALSPIPLPLRPALLGGGILFSLESSPALPLTACVALKNPPLPAPRSGAGVVHIYNTEGFRVYRERTVVSRERTVSALVSGP